jgi:probable HAF family extracellular repeat protein
MTNTPALRATAVASLIALAAAGAQAAPLYHLTDLGPASTPTGINKADQVSGALADDTPAEFTDGAWASLKTPTGGATTTGINATASISGYMNRFPRTAVLWKPSGKLVKIPTVNPGDAHTGMTAYGIADDGTVVGTATAPSGVPFTTFAFTFLGGAVTNLGVPAGGSTSDARAINSQGQIVGQAMFVDSAAPGHAFLYTGGDWRDLGTLGGPSSLATAINARSHVAGCADTTVAGHPHAFLYRNGSLTDLGVPAGGATSCAAGIANDDTVVGTWIDSVNQAHAFIYKDGVRYDKLAQITDAGTTWRYNSLNGVNPRGDIVGLGRMGAGGEDHVFMLTLISP